VRFVLLTLAVGLAWGSPAIASPKKPSAPVEVQLESKPIAGGYEVRLVATPTRDVPTIELSVAGKQLAFGATVAGQARELVTRVRVRGGDGLEIVGNVIAAGRNRARVMRLGPPQQRAAKRVQVYTLPDGRQIGEVRR